MASQSSVFSEAGGSGQGTISSSEVRSEDLPSKRLLGKGLASIGYETELNGMRFARKDFVGVPIGVFKTEAAKLLGLKDQENVVKTHYMAADEVCCSLVVDLMDDDFLAVLHKRKRRVGDRSSTDLSCPFELPEALGFMLQIARGMEHLHDQGFVHGDLKTKNILVIHAEDGSLSLKVSDFGLVETKRRSMSYVSRHARKLGMARWKAPELLKMEDQEETSSESDEEEGVGASTDDDLCRADVYSFALTCCHLLTGEEPYPYPNWRDLVAKIAVDGLRPTLPAACPRSLRGLLVACWSKDHAQRPSFTLVRRELEVLHQESAVHQSSSTVRNYSDVVNESNRRIPPTSTQLGPTRGPEVSLPPRTLSPRGYRAHHLNQFSSVELPSSLLEVKIRLSKFKNAFVRALRSELRQNNMEIEGVVSPNSMISVKGIPPDHGFDQHTVLAIVKQFDSGAVLVPCKYT